MLLAPVRALAEPSPQDLAIARKLFDDARALMKAGKYVEACPKLEEGLKLNPGVGMKFNLAECYEHVGKTASAWSLYLDVAAASKAAKSFDKERAARQRAEKLEPTLARVTVVVPVSARVAGLSLTRNDEPIGAGQYDVAIVLDPGRYVIAAQAPGKLPWSTAVVLATSANVTVTVPVLEDVPKPPPALPPQEPFPWVPAVVAGVGVVGLGVGSYFGLHARALNRDSAAHCAGNLCDSIGFQTRTDARASGNLATVSFAVGFGALATSVVLYLTRPRPEQARAAWSVAPLADRGGLGLAVGGAF